MKRIRRAARTAVLATAVTFVACGGQGQPSLVVAVQGVEQARAEFDLPPGSYEITVDAEVVNGFAEINIQARRPSGDVMAGTTVVIPAADLGLLDGDTGSGSTTVVVQPNKQAKVSVPVIWTRPPISGGANVEVVNITTPGIASVTIPGGPVLTAGDPLILEVAVTNADSNTQVGATVINPNIGVGGSITLFANGTSMFDDITVTEFIGSTSLSPTGDGPIAVVVTATDGASAFHRALKFVAYSGLDPRDVLLNDPADVLNVDAPQFIGGGTLVTGTITTQGGMQIAGSPEILVMGIDQNGQVVTGTGSMTGATTWEADLPGNVTSVQAMGTFGDQSLKVHVVTGSAPMTP